MLLKQSDCLGDQWAAITHRDGPARVISGPGTGKTTTLANRIVHLVQDGVDPKQILALTFNKAAADELKERSIKLMQEAGIELETQLGKDDQQRTVETLVGADVRTYHSLGFLIAKSVLDVKPWESVITDPTWMIKYLLSPEMPPLRKGDQSRRGMGWNDPENDDDATIDPKDAMKELERPMADMVLPSEFRHYLEERWGPEHDDLGKWAQLYAMYQHEKQLKGKVTFADMLYVAWLVLTGEKQELRYNVGRFIPGNRGIIPAYKLLANADETFANNPLQYWRNRWTHIMVDESQDTDALQGRVATLLAGGHRNLMVVGDPNQSIYKFRGARPDFIEGLMRDEFPGHKVYALDHTRRFPTEIVEVANRLIEINPQDEHYRSLKSARKQGEHALITTNYYEGGEFDQAAGIVAEIVNILGDVEHVDPARFDDFGIIGRTHATLATLEPSLFSAGIPYRVMGGGSAFNRREVVAAMAFMEAMTTAATFPELKMILNIAAHDNPKATHFLGAAALDLFKDWCEEPTRSEMAPVDALYQLVNGYRPNYVKPYMTKGLASFFAELQRMKALARENAKIDDPDGPICPIHYIQAAREIAVDAYVVREYGERDEDGDSRFEVLIGLEKLAREYPDTDAFITLVRRLQDDAAQPKDDKKPAVLVGTCHRWKGLERDTIFVVSMDNGIWPHKRTNGYIEGDMAAGMVQGDIPEERRLAFVAVTRAKDRLYVNHFGASIFAEEMGLLSHADAEDGLTDMANASDEQALGNDVDLDWLMSTKSGTISSIPAEPMVDVAQSTTPKKKRQRKDSSDTVDAAAKPKRSRKRSAVV